MRAFCALFLFYLWVVPVPALLVYCCMEDYATNWVDLVEVYHGAARELPRLFPFLISHDTFIHSLAGIFLLPAAAFAWTIKYGMFVIPIAALLAYDTVLMHGGELSDTEFHESRCDYWRKRSFDPLELDAALSAAAALERSRQHPDKGRTDARHYLLEQLRHDLPDWAKPLLDVTISLIEYFYYKGAFVINYLFKSRVYTCLSA